MSSTWASPSTRRPPNVNAPEVDHETYGVGLFGVEVGQAALAGRRRGGVLGFFMRRYDFLVGPVILGVILGPLAETQFRRALQVSQGDPTVFFTRPLSLLILLLALVALLLPYVSVILQRLRGERPEQGRTVFGEGDED
jgi:TctA family transporter